MESRRLAPFFYTIIVVLAFVVASLYFASYFLWGILFLAAAILCYFVFRSIIGGRASVHSEITQLLKKLLVPVVGIIIAVCAGGILMLFTHYDPIESYKALFYGGFVKNWHVSVLNAVPLIFTGLSIAFAFSAGLFNIGAEGQFYVGSMVATFLALYFDFNPFLSILLIFMISGILSAAYNFIPAILKVKTGAHEVITTMMFAHIARYLSPIFIRSFGGDPATSKHAYVTDEIAQTNWIPVFKDVLPNANYRLHIGILLACGMAIFVYYLLHYTKIGFEIRATGQNPHAARALGISTGKSIMIALMFAGFLSGLSGVNQVLGLDHKMFENLNAGYGWNGISVALLASNNPIGVIFTSLLWGALDSGGQYMARTTQTPNSVVEIIKGIILFLIVAKYLYTVIGNAIHGKKAEKGGLSSFRRETAKGGDAS